MSRGAGPAPSAGWQAASTSRQAEGRLPSVVGAVFDRYGAVWAGGAGDAPGPRRAVPDRLDHQDDDRRPGAAGARRRAARPRRPARRRTWARSATPTATVRDAARAHLGHAERAARSVVGAHPGRRLRRARRRQRRLRPGGAGRGSGSTTPTSATACSARSSPAGSARPWWDAGARPAAPARSACGRRRTSRGRARSRAGASTTSPASGSTSRSPTPARWRRPASSGRPSADLVTWGQVLGGARPDVLAPATLRRDAAARSPPGYGLGLMLGVHPGGRLVGHNGSMPGFLAVAARGPRQRHRRGGADQRHHRHRPAGARRLAASRATPTPTDERPAPWRPTARPARRTWPGVPGVWFWGNTAYDVRWHNDGLELRLMARGGLLKERFELVDGVLRRRRWATTAASGSTSYAVRTGRSATSSARPSSTRARPTTPTSTSRAATRPGSPDPQEPAATGRRALLLPPSGAAAPAWILPEGIGNGTLPGCERRHRRHARPTSGSTSTRCPGRAAGHGGALPGGAQGRERRPRRQRPAPRRHHHQRLEDRRARGLRPGADARTARSPASPPQPGGYDWDSDESASQSIFSGGGLVDSLIKQSWERFKFGGRPARSRPRSSWRSRSCPTTTSAPSRRSTGTTPSSTPRSARSRAARTR